MNIPDEEQAADGRYRIAAVDRALDVIEALARLGPAPLARIAEEAGVTRTAAFRVLRTLQARDFAVQEPHGAWRMGLRWAAAAAPAVDQRALALTADQHLRGLARLSGHTVSLRVRRGTTAATIARVQPPEGLAARIEPDEGGPLHVGSGRLLLAYAPPEVCQDVLSQRLPRYTPGTRADPSRIAADLPRIRARGWLNATDEVAASTVVLAAPVCAARGEIVAALTLSASALRLRPPEAGRLIPALLSAAAALSKALGSR